MKEVEKQLITKIITQDFGISMHLKGDHYIEEAAILALQDSSIFVMQMYQTIAERHIHIGANGHTPQTLRNLANLMASHERLIADALKIDQGRMNRYCRTVNPQFIEQLNRKKPTNMAQFADIWYTANGANYGRNQHYNDSRYHMLNYHATFTKGTIEFRLFQFDKPANGRKNGLHAGQLKSYIQLCLALSEMAKELRTASPKPQQTENPKFAMRTWLIRLGLVGEEFATARNFLTKNLDGDAAFRFGR